MSDQITLLTNALDSFNDELQKLIGKKESLEKLISNKEKEEKKLLHSQDVLSKAKNLLELFVKGTETRIREYIEPTVTEALHFVFSQSLYFHIYFVSRRDQVEVDFVILPSKETENEYQKYLEENNEDKLKELVDSYKDIEFNFGGAVAEVLGLVLWLLLVEFLNIKGPICLDEPTSAVHEVYASKVGVFIKSLSERFNRQIIFVTHSQAMAASANKVYDVKKLNEISVVEEI